MASNTVQNLYHTQQSETFLLNSQPFHEPLGQCNYCRSATKQLDIYHIPGNQFICNNFERTFKVAQKVYWTGKPTTTVGATKQLDISHIPSKI